MKIEDRIENSLKEIDMLLEQKVTVYFVNLIGDKILINNNGLPSLVLQKKDLNNTVIQNKLEYLFGTNIKNFYAHYCSQLITLTADIQSMAKNSFHH